MLIIKKPRLNCLYSIIINFLFYFSFFVFTERNIYADGNIRIRGLGAINETGEYNETNKKAEKMTSKLNSVSLFIGDYGLGQSKLTTTIKIGESTLDLISNWNELYLLFNFNETTTFTIGLGSTNNGEGKLTTIYSTVYNTNKVSGKNWSAMMGFEYNPFFLPQNFFIDYLELLFGFRENLIEYNKFNFPENQLANDSIKVNSIQMFWGLGMVF